MDVKVKICGITNLEDAFAAAEAGADALGFMFYEGSARRVSVEEAEKIALHLPPRLMRVGVFVNPSVDLVKNAIDRCRLNLLQFHGDESPEFCCHFGLKSMKAFRIKDATSLTALSCYATDVFLLDSYVAGQAGGTGAKFNWELAVAAKQLGRPIFLAGGLIAGNVAEAIRLVQPFGVDVSSGVESAPGRKDHAKIREFVAAVRSA